VLAWLRGSCLLSLRTAVEIRGQGIDLTVESCHALLGLVLAALTISGWAVVAAGAGAVAPVSITTRRRIFMVCRQAIIQK
jgi:hypothetical protein